MKGIIKNKEPDSFARWKAKANEEWQPTFGSLQNPEKAQLRTSLLEEQGYLCAYCCGEIENNSQTTIIEHFIPQSDSCLGKTNALNYDNLFACCNGTKQDGKTGKLVFCCDKSKEDKFNNINPEITVIKPTKVDTNSKFVCEQAFGYGIDGGIFSIDNIYYANSKYTIELLELNIQELKRERTAVLDFLFEDLELGILFNFSSTEVSKLKETYQNKHYNKYYPFCQTILYFLDKYYP